MVEGIPIRGTWGNPTREGCDARVEQRMAWAVEKEERRTGLQTHLGDRVGYGSGGNGSLGDLHRRNLNMEGQLGGLEGRRTGKQKELRL